MGKIPVNIISGFLGSGKTTAIIQLLGQRTSDEPWAVIINEFGKISIDSQTLQSSSAAGDVFDISGGCICCSAKGYFRENLDKIVRSGNYSRIIIEPSGLGGIEMVSEIIAENSSLSLMPVICLVDINLIENSRLQINQVYKMQIQKSDIILFTKCDLLTNEAIELSLVQKFKSLFPDKYIAGKKLLYSLLEKDFNVKNESTYRMLSNGNPGLLDTNYQTINYLFKADTIFDAEKLTHFFHNHSSEILRAKGYVKTENGWNLLNFTLSGLNIEPCQNKEQNEIVIIFDINDQIIIHTFDVEIQKCCTL